MPPKAQSHATAAQPANEVEAKDDAPVDEVFSLTLVEEAALEASTMIGGTISVTWRTRARNRFVVAGEWTEDTGKIHDFDHEFPTKVSLLLPSLQDGHGETVVPFPNPDCEYKHIRLVAGTASKKRLRESTQPIPMIPPPSPPFQAHQMIPASPSVQATPPNMQDTALLFARASHQVLVEAKTKRAMVEVAGGDGLRIPASIPKILSPMYPPIWLQRRANGEAPSILKAEWSQAWTDLALYHGALFKTDSHRLEFLSNVRAVTATVFEPSAPGSKDDWREVFTYAFKALSEILLVSQGRSVEEKVSRKMKMGFDDNALDVEDAIRSVETAGSEATAAVATPVSVDQLASLRAQVAQLQASNAQMQAKQQSGGQTQRDSFRGRGGRGRGGRGGGFY
jgi:hypothetical protein